MNHQTIRQNVILALVKGSSLRGEAMGEPIEQALVVLGTDHCHRPSRPDLTLRDQDERTCGETTEQISLSSQPEAEIA